MCEDGWLNLSVLPYPSVASASVVTRYRNGDPTRFTATGGVRTVCSVDIGCSREGASVT